MLAAAGAGWIILVLRFGPLPLARLSKYLGAFGARWVEYRGIDFGVFCTLGRTLPQDQNS
jgi:hypothetical protein